MHALEERKTQYRDKEGTVLARGERGGRIRRQQRKCGPLVFQYTGIPFAIYVTVSVKMEILADIKLLDSFNGTALQTFNGHMNSKQLPLGRSPQNYFMFLLMLKKGR
jgi:hypothetical protein